MTAEFTTRFVPPEGANVAYVPGKDRQYLRGGVLEVVMFVFMREPTPLGDHGVVAVGTQHPDRVGIPGRDVLEGEFADLFALEPDLARLEQRMGLDRNARRP
jgi:hypothetical protein